MVQVPSAMKMMKSDQRAILATGRQRGEWT
jgi:hypothetical protein